MKTVLITAGSHGIGAAVAKLLGDEYQIVISYRGHEDEAKELAKSLPHAVAYKADLSDPGDIDKLIKKAEEHFETIDVLVHCASTFPNANIDTTDADLWRETIDANLTTAFLTVKAVLPAMRAQKWGRIVTFVDSGVWSGNPFPEFLAYSTAKAGLMQFIRSVAKTEIKNGITANAIAPSVVENSEPKPPEKYMPIGRWITLDEVAAAVKHLISEEAAVTTGAILPVTGGVGL